MSSLCAGSQHGVQLLVVESDDVVLKFSESVQARLPTELWKDKCFL